MPAYRQIPLLRPLIALILGILAAYRFPDWNLTYVLSIGVISLLASILFQFLSFERKLRLYWLSTLSLLSVFFVLGYFSVIRKDISRDVNWIGLTKDSTFNMALVLDDNPVTKTKTVQTTGSLIVIEDNDQYKSSSGKILLRIDTSIQNQYHLKAGDTILVKSPLHPIQNFPNSNFDAITYYKRLQIYHQSNIKKARNLLDIKPN